jgi:transposase-like protein
MRLYEVATKFADERHCIEHLVNMRSPNGVKCVYCKSDWVARYDSHGKTGKFRRVYECGDCHKQFTAQSGTLFHDSHLPLHKWFMAIALICESKKGMSAKQIQRALGISYKTAWYLAHRIREAMQDSNGFLSGIVEIDETYIGGKKTGQGVYAGKRSKTPVIGMRERGGDLRFIKTADAKSSTVKELIEQNVSKDVRVVMTDDSVIYPYALKDTNFKHRTVVHSKGEYVRYTKSGPIHTNTVESAFSLLKRGIVGTYHQLSVKHLQRYLHEFEWRFNRRKEQSAMHSLVLRNLTQREGMPYKKLTHNSDL